VRVFEHACMCVREGERARERKRKFVFEKENEYVCMYECMCAFVYACT